MDCPNCKIKMNQIKTKSHYGANVFVDQCLECGGIWFDNMELYEIDENATETIDKIDTTKLVSSANINPELHCPKDKAKLLLFSDPSFPDSIKVESCPECDGFFFNRGEFLAFNENREKRLAEKDVKMDDELSLQVEKLLSLDSTASPYNTLGNLGRFLSKKYYQSPEGIRPVDSISQQMADSSFNSGAISASGVMNVVTFLLRFFLRV